MSVWTILRGSLLFYWRTHLGVIIGAALGAMVLTGALLVGDSVKATLRKQALDRVGMARSAVLATDRFFRSGDNAEDSLAGGAGNAAPVLLVSGSLARADGSARINRAQVAGVDQRFWALAPEAAPALPAGQLALNTRAATQLGAKVGDTLVLRVEKPSAFSRDAPLSGEENEDVAIRATVGAIVDDAQYGRFALQASQVAPFTVFVPLADLQGRLQVAGRANLLLTAAELPAVRQSADQLWRLTDAGLELRPVPTGGFELRTSRVFLDEAVANAAKGAEKLPPSVEALTYFVNELRVGEKAAPYSMVTAVEAKAAGFLPADLRDDEIVISQWLADDLGAVTGAKLTLKYFVMGEHRQLTEKAQDFTVRAVIPADEPQWNGTWMPDFPGLADKQNCRDWKPGFQFDSTRIRDKDQQYWEKYRGAPKAFVTLTAGQSMWSNRWGNLTSIRWPEAKASEEIATALRGKLTLPELGFQFLPLREQALAATDAPVDFGELFVYFSFFLLAAAAVLTGLLFVFSLEQRNREAGLLLAFGWKRRNVRRLFLAEGAALATVGSVIGVAGAGVYTVAVLHALRTVWKSAVGSVSFGFHMEGSTLAIGVLSGVAIAVGSMWLASRRQLKHSARELLNAVGAIEPAGPAKKGRSWSFGVAIFCVVAAAGCLVFDKSHSPETFFCAGGLLLTAGLAFGLTWLRRLARETGGVASLERMGLRNAARRRGRSMAVAAVLASGVFMVAAVDAFRESPSGVAQDRLSGTGGFALAAESALPIYEDLNTAGARETYGLDDDAMKGVSFVAMRVREGDDASCLNLNRALQPRLYGASEQELVRRGAFRFSGVAKGMGVKDATPDAAWALLEAQPANGAIPAVIDEATLQWALQKSLGDTLDYQDERGQTFKVQFVATLAGSMLQGGVFIAEKQFIAKYPNQGGFRFFLIDAPAERMAPVAQELSRALADRGFEAGPAGRRLAEFQAVENAYLSIFQALGGLGMLLASVGLAIVVARNVLERRGEFGLLAAVGFRSRDLRKLVFAEHRWLIVCGLVVGGGSAVLAVWPHLHDRAGGFPAREMGLLGVALALGSLFWTWLATRLALRGDRIGALRAE